MTVEVWEKKSEVPLTLLALAFLVAWISDSEGCLASQPLGVCPVLLRSPFTTF